MYSNQKPTEFICLLLKLLQIQPEKEILIEYLQVDEFKSVSLPQILGSEVATIPPAEGLLFYSTAPGIFALWLQCTYG